MVKRYPTVAWEKKKTLYMSFIVAAFTAVWLMLFRHFEFSIVSGVWGLLVVNFWFSIGDTFWCLCRHRNHYMHLQYLWYKDSVSNPQKRDEPWTEYNEEQTRAFLIFCRVRKEIFHLVSAGLALTAGIFIGLEIHANGLTGLLLFHMIFMAMWFILTLISYRS